jgi:hypothetical protein
MPFDLMQQFWGKIVCPRASRLPFERAVQLAQEGVTALFANFNYGRGALAGGFFPSALRNPILQAAVDQTLLRMAYHGSVRLIEPYALAYKVRSDGVGQEYFYAYDTTGGNSGRGIKSFLQSGIARLENTDIKFQPRFRIELAKSAGREGVGYFGSPFSSTRSFTPRHRTARGRSGPVYKVRCTYCGKTFTRKTSSTRLNPHKDGYGNRCPGRSGFRV